MSDRPGKYIRDTYGVPAFIRRRVRFTGLGPHRAGRITGFRGAYLLVRFDGETTRFPYQLHPTWAVEYLTPEVTP